MSSQKCPICDSSSRLMVVELQDKEIKLITKQELENWKKKAIEFDGFESWIIKGTLCEHKIKDDKYE